MRCEYGVRLWYREGSNTRQRRSRRKSEERKDAAVVRRWLPAFPSLFPGGIVTSVYSWVVSLSWAPVGRRGRGLKEVMHRSNRSYSRGRSEEATRRSGP